MFVQSKRVLFKIKHKMLKKYNNSQSLIIPARFHRDSCIYTNNKIPPK